MNSVRKILSILGVLLLLMLAASALIEPFCSKNSSSERELAELALNPDLVNILRVNQVGRVTLSEIPSAGYFWHLESSLQAGLQLLEELQPGSGRNTTSIGGSTTYVARFQAVEAGSYALTFLLYRPWLGQDSAIEEVSFSIIIREN